MFDFLVELGFLRLECIGLALFVLLCPDQCVDLDEVLLILLLESFKLGLLRVEADLKQVLLLFNFLFACINFCELLSHLGEFFLEALFLFDHFLDVIVGANGK